MSDPATAAATAAELQLAVEDGPGDTVEELLAKLETEPVRSLEALRDRLPWAAPAVVAAMPQLGPLICSEDSAIADAASELLHNAKQLLTNSSAEIGAGCRLFEYRGTRVEYWELDHTDDHLLFGYGVWPAAELLAKLFINADLDGVSDGDAVVAVRGKTVLEVGSGVGLTGLACRECGARKVLLTDAEQRLVDALREKHGHMPELAFDSLDWKTDQGGEHFDVVLGCDILLSVCEGHIYAPRVLAARLRRRPESRGYLIAPFRNVCTHDVAVNELEKEGLHVEIFVVSAAAKLLRITKERLEQLSSRTQLLLVARWFAAEEQAELDEDAKEVDALDADWAELLALPP
eukprot:TRINITY_DN93138_c0_g1_i1.p1 TRINITY_DN93138_c0_g1~~TRINITY_DN93138_c0_g1_i1.p1  ORF type:complete len:348 (-),score=111.24 TRINITY_DN93138_c0_g1_i1:21-1064(-)